ncbi:hypothetical protein DW103_07125 [Parabacteroides sp. AM08-6]|nr:hypothetical protein DW103_07125 [Parabacteroides sp. AM08-6]
MQNIKKARIQLHSYIRTKQITNSTYMKKQILLTLINKEILISLYCYRMYFLILYFYNSSSNDLVQNVMKKVYFSLF